MTGILTFLAMLLGGLTFFLYGMSTMSGGLEQMAGGGLERTMNKVAANDFSGFFLGAGITVAIQSSSAFTVMLVGLVNSGILDFSNTFGMIMGSNVGTTLTAWLLSLIGIGKGNFFITLLQPTTFAPLLAFIGIVLKMMGKSNKKQNLGLILIGFAILIFGMDLMSKSMDFIRINYEKEFTSFLGTLKSPIVALLVSTVFTGVIQSSAATIGIVQALALSGSITWEMAIPLVLGANIGTCVTALISSVGTNKNAKKVVVMHFFVNVFGSILCMIILYILKIFGVTILDTNIAIWGVAVVHTLFNAINTVILLPIKKLLIKFCELVVPSKEDEQKHTVFLDERIFHNAPFAISECHRLAGEMAEYTRDALLKSIKLISDYDAEVVNYIRETENLTDKYEDKLGTYLVRLSNNELSENNSHSVARMLHSIGDFERISDHALNVAKLAEEMHEKNISFSNDALRELDIIGDAVTEIINMTVDSFINDDTELSSHVEPLEQVIDKLKKQLKAMHITRLQNNECTIELGFIFTDLLTNYERVSDHCSNIAVYTMQLPTDMLDAHKYLNRIKHSATGAFVDDYNMYEAKYKLN
ncbi:MAG: Na/Pi cotransporter family protein [Acutalibacteraceae bacterium]|nr:Na/Pi cotransporter family protein [Acutalibacteraceae bacterium]